MILSQQLHADPGCLGCKVLNNARGSNSDDDDDDDDILSGSWQFVFGWLKRILCQA